jgi:hypothetical protein
VAGDRREGTGEAPLPRQLEGAREQRLERLEALAFRQTTLVVT